MAKAAKPYEIDFKFLRNKTDILFNEDGTERYTDRDLADAVLAQNVHLLPMTKSLSLTSMGS